ncbi:C1 family peptidase [Sulfuritalea sp.]|uniref:C1 family peptidase n=1 Tax=Sulfuritalea sp. TaxID=2480090 RepID=UPI00286E75B2|nr:C1 family peptidase [Sulfuritalea sp.]
MPKRKPPLQPKRDPRRTADRDAFDARDSIYSPALIELPPALYPKWEWIVPLDQGREGACTGFGLAAVINYQLAARRKRKPARTAERVSARMLFQVAKRYDQWAGEDYDWSSARGAMKGWFKTGVCSEAAWPNPTAKRAVDHLTPARQQEALRCPLGAYYRVYPRRSDVHAALLEAGAVYAVADTHDGWNEPNTKGEIPYWDDARGSGGGGHAFAIVGYTAEGFLVQNSWGPDWGGFKDRAGNSRPAVALWRYADFDRNVWDLWVARMALPVESLAALAGPGYRATSAGGKEKASGPPAHEIWGRYLHIDDGQFDPRGDYPSHEHELDGIVARLMHGSNGDRPRHIVLYAHGGLNTVAGSAIRCGKWSTVFARNGIAELHFVWETGFLAELRDVLLGKEQLVQQRVGAVSDWWDDWVEKLTQPLGYPLWQEMRSDAEIAFQPPPAAGSAFVTKLVAALKAVPAPPQVHLVCHSAGAIWTGHLLDAWKAAGGPPVANLLLFAPACTVDFFFARHAPRLADGTVANAHLFQLDDAVERDDNVAVVYRKSLLYLVSRSYQEKVKVVPLLGMAKHYADVAARLAAINLADRLSCYIAGRDAQRSKADSHGGFDNDLTTMNAMLALVLGQQPLPGSGFAETDMNGY